MQGHPEKKILIGLETKRFSYSKTLYNRVLTDFKQTFWGIFKAQHNLESSNVLR